MELERDPWNYYKDDSYWLVHCSFTSDKKLPQTAITIADQSNRRVNKNWFISCFRCSASTSETNKVSYLSKLINMLLKAIELIFTTCCFFISIRKFGIYKYLWSNFPLSIRDYSDLLCIVLCWNNFYYIFVACSPFRLLCLFTVLDIERFTRLAWFWNSSPFRMRIRPTHEHSLGF